jgi:8-oxo-dGTP pyrophosphatase MutT (NUDIX family)
VANEGKPVQEITKLSSRVVYQNAWMTVREDDIKRADGSLGIYGVIDKPAFSMIMPYEEGSFWLVEQYRYTVGARYWEFPQGTFPNRQDGDPEDLARAELQEETGLTAGRLQYVGRLYNAYGMSSQPCHAFLATDLTEGQESREAEEQDMRSARFTIAEFEDMIRSGQVVDSGSIAAYTLLRLHGHLDRL